jgi:ABC-type dipeptide/oligopeptide/nickel transport system permease component
MALSPVPESASVDGGAPHRADVDPAAQAGSTQLAGAPAAKVLHAWARMLVRRLLFFAVALFLVLSATWLLTRVVGGNPGYRLAGPQPTPSEVHSIDVRLGLTHSLADQYLTYLSNLAHLNLGTDFFTGQSVSSEIATTAPATIQLVLAGAIIATVLGVGLGALSALRRGRLVDNASRAGSVIVLSVPDFFLGLILILLFFYEVHIFPAPIGQLPAGTSPPRHVTGFVFLDGFLTGSPGLSWQFLAHLALPAITLGLIYSAPIYRLTRAAMLQALSSDSVLFAESCGLPRRLVARYALRQSMSVAVTSLGVVLAALIGGDVLVEQVFSWGGLGQLGVQAVVDSNYPAIQAFVLVVGVAALVIYAAVDIAYLLIDPRVRFT